MDPVREPDVGVEQVAGLREIVHVARLAGDVAHGAVVRDRGVDSTRILPGSEGSFTGW
jgi:hypothetical protein